MAISSHRCRIVGLVAALASLVPGAAASRAAPYPAGWPGELQQVADELLCLRLATDADRASLRTAVVEEALDELGSGGSARSTRDGAAKQLVVLRLVARLASRSGDPQLESEAMEDVVALSHGAAKLPGPLRLQIERCALASWLTALVELDHRAAMLEASRRLAAEYEKAPIGPDAEDWPLAQALRELSLLDRATHQDLGRRAASQGDGVNELLWTAQARARLLQEAHPARAARLLAAAAQLLVARGDAAHALATARQSSNLAERDRTAEGSWRHFPAEYDALTASGDGKAARELAASLAGASAAPEKFADHELEFEVALRRADAETVRDVHAARELWWRGWTALNSGRPITVDAERLMMVSARGTASVRFIRRAIAQSARYRYSLADEDARAPPRTRREKRYAGAKAYNVEKRRAEREVHASATVPLLLTHHHAPTTPPQDILLRDVRDQIAHVDRLDAQISELSNTQKRIGAGEFSRYREKNRTKLVDLSLRLLQLRSRHRMAAAFGVQAAAAEGLDLRRPLDLAASGAGGIADKTAMQFVLRFMPSRYLRSVWQTLHTRVFPDVSERAGGLDVGDATRAAFERLETFHREITQGMVPLPGSKLRDRFPPHVLKALFFDPGSVEDYRALLGEKDGLVAFAPTDYGLFAWVVTREGAALERIDLERVDLQVSYVGDLVERVRASVVARRSGNRLTVPPFDAADSYKLYRATLGRVRDHVRDKTHLYWFAAGSLAALPPSLLVEETPRAALASSTEELRALRWVVDRYAISVLPDLSILTMERAASTRVGGKRAFLGIGAPLLSADEVAHGARPESEALAGRSGARSLGQLAKLPESADELRALSSLFGADRSLLLLGPAATKDAVTRELSVGARVVAFATHGFTASEVRGVSEPALLLADPSGQLDDPARVLSSSEVAGARIGADLVLLSACNTATSDGRPRGETFTGLTTSFSAAGARALLVSHWPVASGAAAALSVGTVERSRRERLPVAESLQRAMRELRDAPGDTDLHAHPFYWAPFVVVGDGTRPVD